MAHSCETGLALSDVMALREVKCGTCTGWGEVFLGHTAASYFDEGHEVYDKCPTCKGRGVVPEGFECPDEAEAVECLLMDRESLFHVERGVDL